LGRTGRRSIAVVISGARPIFLTLKAPGSVKRNAKSLRLKISTSLPARLLVRGSHVPAQGYSVGRKARTVSVRVGHGTGRLTLRLRLTSGGKTTSSTVVIRRK
jgi:hypothetical protein